MGNERFRITGVRVGSAARSAESAAHDAPTAPFSGIRAGSAPKLAEDAKRLDRQMGGEVGPATAGVSLPAGRKPFQGSFRS